MKSIATLVLASCLAFGLSGCAATAADSGADEISNLVTRRTVVRRNADGTESVKVQTIPRAQQIAEMKQRAQTLAAAAAARAEGLGTTQQAIVEDTSCEGSSLWIFDATVGSEESGWTYGYGDLYGSENEICFYGEGTAYLQSYEWSFSELSHETTSWSGQVRSYWPGNESGFFEWIDNDLYLDEDFSAGANATNAGSFAQHAQEVILTD
jgi:hypothetical protein